MADDRELDRMLEEELTAVPPPGDQLTEITPWRRAIVKIACGVALTTITLNIGYLPLILSAAGLLLLLQGSWMLCRESRWFVALYALTLVRMVLFWAVLAGEATVFWAEGGIPLEPVYAMLLALPLAQDLCLWWGVRAVRRVAGQPAGARAAGALVWCRLLLYALGLLGLEGWLAVGPVLILYGVALYNLFRLRTLLDGAGYAFKMAPARLPQWAAWTLWAVLLLGGILLAGRLWGSYHMDWTVRGEAEQAGLEEIRSNLLDLGMPLYVLDDLTAQDLAALERAVRVEVEADGSYFLRERFQSDGLLMTNVAVELPGMEWRTICHFLWKTGPRKLDGTECLKIWPSYLSLREAYRSVGEPSGRVLYDRDGVTYSALYHFLGEIGYTADTALFGSTSQRFLFAAFSLPEDGEARRGYVTYGFQVLDDGWIMSEEISYTHQARGTGYPLTTALLHELSGGGGGKGFAGAVSGLQFYPYWEPDVE